MMETQDNKVDFVKFNGLEHSFKTIKEVEAVYKAIMPFLQRHIAMLPDKQYAQ